MLAKSALTALSVAILSALLIAQAPTPRPATPAPRPASPAIPAAPATPSATKPAEKPLYDEQADAKQQIAAALASAKKENRRVLIQWGGNWCGWCIALHGLYEKDADIRKTLSYEYDVVFVDAGRAEKNADLAKSYGANIKGYPHLTILDSSGKTLVNQDTDPLEVKGPDGNSVGVSVGHDKTKVLAFLQKYVATPLKADDLYAKALLEAKTSNRLVFLHFGAPWCGWCHKLEDWMARPEINTLLTKDFVEVKIDTDRTTGGKEFAEKMGATGGIPWYSIIDPAGKSLITSSTGGENIGFPATPEEVTRFGAMLKKTAHNLTPADIQKLTDSLKPAEK